MSDATPTAVVLGATEADPPPGIEAAAGFLSLRYAPDLEALRAALPGAPILFIWGMPPGALAGAWDLAGDLRWIQASSAGVDHLLFPELAGSDVVVSNARGVFDPWIAEWVVGAMLAFTTGLHRSIVAQQEHRWGRSRHIERLAGRRLVVVGPGPIGRGAASRAAALGMQVAVVGRTARVDEDLGPIAGIEQLHDEVASADFVLDALPLTEGTRGLFDAAAFDAMPGTARFLNVGRGATVDEDALIEALRSGSIAGAALDVFEEEPLPETSPLWDLPTVIVSPHISGDVEGWEAEVVDLFVRNARRWVRGDPPANVIDKRAGHG